MNHKVGSLAWDVPLNGTKKIVLLALAYHSDKNGICTLSAKEISEKAGISKATFWRELNELINQKLIQKASRFSTDGGAITNAYQVMLGDNANVQIN